MSLSEEHTFSVDHWHLGWGPGASTGIGRKVGRTEGKEDLEGWLRQPAEGMSPQS